ncbi:hypothetical protein PINS_up005549 [Pythium insidiosum]|nr:hypothetical protein PINS_up005549 [Pythium insidiosum]
MSSPAVNQYFFEQFQRAQRGRASQRQSPRAESPSSSASMRSTSPPPSLSWHTRRGFLPAFSIIDVSATLRELKGTRPSSPNDLMKHSGVPHCDGEH